MMLPWHRLLITLSIIGIVASFPACMSILLKNAPVSRNPTRLCVARAMNVDLPASIDVAAIEKLSETAIIHRGEKEGLKALEELAQLCDLRLPYDFKAGRDQIYDGRVVAHIPKLLSPDVIENFLRIYNDMEKKAWLSTNPDSVDGLPSLHLNLVSNGRPLVPLHESSSDPDDFDNSIRGLLLLVQPFLYEELLPMVNSLLNSTSVRISDVFLRRYGQDVVDDKSRNGISTHYDVYSKVTAVIAMDDVAAKGRNGLFTTEESSGSTKRTSNHAALRRFFPLTSGDGVVHTWDVLHGVDVQAGLDRTSLIVWFTADEALQSSCGSVAPWLTDRSDLETNDVAQFVLASAIESLTPEQSAFFESDVSSSDISKRHPCDLYLDSASRGNVFALTRLGSLCEDNQLTPDMAVRAKDLLDTLRPVPKLPKALQEDNFSPMGLAKRFWLEGAMQGNPLAQMALADEIMMEASSTGDEDSLLLAAVLFGLAAQQGNEQASASFMKVMNVVVESSEIQSQEEFSMLPVTQVARIIFT